MHIERRPIASGLSLLFVDNCTTDAGVAPNQAIPNPTNKIIPRLNI